MATNDQYNSVSQFFVDIKPFFYRKSLVYVDAGAYRGEVLRAAIDSGLNIQEAHLVEPNPKSYEELEHLTAEAFKGRRLMLYNIALSDNPGNVLIQPDKDMTRVIHTSNNSHGPKGETIEVPCDTIDRLSREFMDNRISILKLDVEGSELAVIRGASHLLGEHQIDVIYVEAGMNPSGSQQTYYREIEDALSTHGYKIFRIYEQKHEWMQDSPILRRVNLAFISPKFADEHPYRLTHELHDAESRLERAKTEIEELRQEVKHKNSECETYQQRLDQAIHEVQHIRSEYRNELTELRKSSQETINHLEKCLKKASLDLETEQINSKDKIRGLETDISELKKQVNLIKSSNLDLHRELESARSNVDSYKSKYSLQKRECNEIANYANQLETRLKLIIKSRSWRMMGPLRIMMRFMRRSLFGKNTPKTRLPHRPKVLDQTDPKKHRGTDKEEHTHKTKPLIKRESYISTSLKKLYKGNRNTGQDQILLDVKKRLRTHLWGGLSKDALESLRQIYQNKHLDPHTRSTAAWYAAQWYYSHGETTKAFDLANLIRKTNHRRYPSKQVSMLLAYSYMRMGQINKAKTILEDYLKRNPQNVDALLALSNMHTDADEKLSLINIIYSEAGLSLIHKFRPSDDLTFFNIRSHAGSIVSGPKISVIIPSYNAEHTIDVAIESLLAQSWKNLELIVVDDCSTDGTYDKVVDLSKHYHQIVPVRMNVNSGAYAARNTGLKIATGDLITTHDSDDWSHPQKLEIQALHLEQNSDVMGTITYWVRTTTELHFCEHWRISGELIQMNHSSLMFRRKVYEDLGYWDNVIVTGDTEFLWRMYATYGHNSIIRLRRNIPLSFGLNEESSLTRTSATHVSTIHFGLRHTYRESAKRWHEKSSDSLYVCNRANKRPFPAPTSILSRKHDLTKLDLLIICDFSDAEMSKAASIEISRHPGRKIGLFHWPSFWRAPTPLCDSYFDLIEKDHALSIVAGQRISAKKIIVVDERLLVHKIDKPFVLDSPSELVMKHMDTYAEKTITSSDELIH